MPVPPSRTPTPRVADPETPVTQVRANLSGGTDPWLAGDGSGTQVLPGMPASPSVTAKAPSPASAAVRPGPTSPRTTGSTLTGPAQPGTSPAAPTRDGQSAWETVHGFRLLRPLGRGGMANVFLAQRSDGRHAAIKQLHPQYANDAEIVKRFMLEMKATASIRHPHVIEILDFGELQGQYFIATEYMDAGSLRDLLVRAGGRLPPPAAEAVTAMLLMGLSAAHARNLIHRDIKPANILLSSDGCAKLSDFGIARALDVPGLTRTGLLMGTPAYMAPEQASGHPLDGRSDLFAVGIVLYEMLCGFNPFTGQNEAASLMKIIAADPPLLFEVNPAYPAHLEAFVHRLLARDPAARFASADEALGELARLSPQTVLDPRKVLAEAMVDPAVSHIRWATAEGQGHFARAGALLNEGAARRPQAILELYRAHTLAPFMTGAEELLQQLFDGRDPFAAPSNPKIAELEALLQSQPNSHALLMQLAALYKLELAPLKSIACYKKALRLRPDDGFAAGQLRALVGDEASLMLSATHLTLKTQPPRPVATHGSSTAPTNIARPQTQARTSAVRTTAPEPAYAPVREGRGVGRLITIGVVLVLIAVGVAAIRGIGRMISSSQETVTAGTEGFRSVVGNDSPGTTAQQVKESVATIREKGDQQFESAMRLVREGSHGAEQALRTFRDENPKHPRAADALFELARLLMKQNQFSSARTELQAFRAGYPTDPRTPEVRTMLGEALAELRETEAAVAELDKVVEEHPSSPVVNRAIWRAAEAYESKGDVETAKKRYQAVMSRTGPADEVYGKSSEALKRLESAATP